MELATAGHIPNHSRLVQQFSRHLLHAYRHSQILQRTVPT
ncbi:hypothetical protein WJX84_011309, partial [Apatococcus fuscideae]